MAQIKGKQVLQGSIDADRLTNATGAGSVLVSQAGGDFAEQAMSGDITIAASGATTIGAGVVSNAKIADGAVSGAKVAANGIEDGKLAISDFNFDLGSASSYPRIKLTGTPSQSDDVASKSYVDSQVLSSSAGLSPKDSVHYTTDSTLAGTYAHASGSSTITAGSNGALNPVAVGATGITLSVGDSVLLRGQSNDYENGIYTITALGDASNPYVLTRRSDADSIAKLAGAFVFAMEGDYADRGYLCTTDDSATFGTDAISFSDFSILSLEGGNGITITGNTSIAANPNTSAGLGVDASGIKIVLPTSSGLEFDGTNGLRVDAEDASLALSANGVKVNADNDTVGLNGGSSLVAAQPVRQDLALETSSDLSASSDDQDTGLTITRTPAGDSGVIVAVNGVGVKIGDGSKTGGDCYFSGDSGLTARAISAITASDKLFWNGVIAGYGLNGTSTTNADGVDVISFHYNALTV